VSFQVVAVAASPRVLPIAGDGRLARAVDARPRRLARLRQQTMPAGWQPGRRADVRRPDRDIVIVDEFGDSS